MITDPQALIRDALENTSAECSEVTGTGEDCRACLSPSRFVVVRSDGDTSYGVNGGSDEACEDHLAHSVAAMIDGDVNVYAVVAIRWMPPESVTDPATCTHPKERRTTRTAPQGTFGWDYEVCGACGSERLLDAGREGEPSDWSPILSAEDAPAEFLKAAGLPDVTETAIDEYLQGRYDAWKAAREPLTAAERLTLALHAEEILADIKAARDDDPCEFHGGEGEGRESCADCQEDAGRSRG